MADDMEDKEDEPVFEEEVGELPNFSEKNCCWTWSWCIGCVGNIVLL